LGRRRDDENIQPLIAMTGLTYENPTSSRRLLFRFCSPPKGQRLPNANASRWRAGGNCFLLPQNLLALPRRDHGDFQRQKGRNCIAYARRLDQSLASNLEASIRV